MQCFGDHLQSHISLSHFLFLLPVGDDHEILNCYAEPRCAGNVLEQEEITDAYFLTVYMQSCTDISIIVDPEFAAGL